MGVLRVAGLVKSFEKHTVVKNVSFQVEDGEFFVILGPSGCGKTTTLRLIAGLESVDSGNIYLDGREITNFPPKIRNIAMVFQSYALYPYLTARQNIQFPLKIRKMSKKDMDAKTEEVAKLLGIGDLLDRKPGEISGGQRQRVALGRAIIREPALFLMDEPLSNLDAKLRTQMRIELKKLQREYKTTTVYVTHDQIEATTLADRACVMNDGNVVQIDPPLDLYNKPVNMFVAAFVGDPPMNLIDGKVIEKNGETILNVSGSEFVIRGSALEKQQEIEVKVGIRPEDLTIGTNGIDVSLAVSQNIGRSFYEYFKTENDETLVSHVKDSNLRIGEKYKLSLDLNKIMLFESFSGKLIFDDRGWKI